MKKAATQEDSKAELGETKGEDLLSDDEDWDWVASHTFNSHIQLNSKDVLTYLKDTFVESFNSGYQITSNCSEMWANFLKNQGAKLKEQLIEAKNYTEFMECIIDSISTVYISRLRLEVKGKFYLTGKQILNGYVSCSEGVYEQKIKKVLLKCLFDLDKKQTNVRAQINALQLRVTALPGRIRFRRGNPNNVNEEFVALDFATLRDYLVSGNPKKLVHFFKDPEKQLFDYCPSKYTGEEQPSRPIIIEKDVNLSKENLVAATEIPKEVLQQTADLATSAIALSAQQEEKRISALMRSSLSNTLNFSPPPLTLSPVNLPLRMVPMGRLLDTNDTKSILKPT